MVGTFKATPPPSVYRTLVLYPSRQSGAFERGPAFAERSDVRARDPGDFVEGFPRQEGLVGRDQHVREREQPREFVVVKNLPGEVLEKNPLLLLIDIESDA